MAQSIHPSHPTPQTSGMNAPADNRVTRSAYQVLSPDQFFGSESEEAKKQWDSQKISCLQIFISHSHELYNNFISKANSPVLVIKIFKKSAGSVVFILSWVLLVTLHTLTLGSLLYLLKKDYNKQHDSITHIDIGVNEQEFKLWLMCAPSLNDSWNKIWHTNTIPQQMVSDTCYPFQERQQLISSRKKMCLPIKKLLKNIVKIEQEQPQLNAEMLMKHAVVGLSKRYHLTEYQTSILIHNMSHVYTLQARSLQRELQIEQTKDKLLHIWIWYDIWTWYDMPDPAEPEEHSTISQALQTTVNLLKNCDQENRSILIEYLWTIRYMSIPLKEYTEKYLAQLNQHSPEQCFNAFKMNHLEEKIAQVQRIEPQLCALQEAEPSAEDSPPNKKIEEYVQFIQDTCSNIRDNTCSLSSEEISSYEDSVISQAQRYASDLCTITTDEANTEWITQFMQTTNTLQNKHDTAIRGHYVQPLSQEQLEHLCASSIGDGSITTGSPTLLHTLLNIMHTHSFCLADGTSAEVAQKTLLKPNQYNSHLYDFKRSIHNPTERELWKNKCVNPQSCRPVSAELVNVD